MATFIEYRITAPAARQDILIALLADAGFDSFEQRDTELLAYAPTANHAASVTRLDELAPAFEFTYTHAPLEDRNWNAVWESGFDPIRVGERLLIRASFHAPDPTVEHELVIDPKMAFGTGHHATTYLMCELLFDYGAAGATVLDYGCGSGVLALLAKQLGAGHTDPVDIEQPAVENTRENAATNGLQLERILHGTLDAVPNDRPYDLILANINRNVILATAGALYERLKPGGRVLFSGILDRDEQLLTDHLRDLGFRHLTTRRRADWRAFVYTR